MIPSYNIEKSDFDIYTEASVLEKVPEGAGIYLLWAKLQKGEWDCIHIGHSSNLRSNLLQHLSKEEKDNSIKSKVQKLICGYEWALISSVK